MSDEVLRVSSPHPLLLPETGPYWGILGLLPFRISILSASPPFPGPEDIKTVFIVENFLVLQAPSQAPHDPDGLAQSRECWPPAWCSLPAPAFASPPPGL